MRVNESVGGPCPRDGLIEGGQEKRWRVQEKTDEQGRRDANHHVYDVLTEMNSTRSRHFISHEDLKPNFLKHSTV